MRKPLIAGNWKMYKNNVEAMELVRDLAPLVTGLDDVEVAVCPPFTALGDVSRLIKELGASISLGAQDVYPEQEGAFTGEISPAMLKSLGVDYVIAGHSERREVIGEDDAFVAAKLRAVLDGGMTPILCVGETLQEREGGRAKAKVEGQLEAGLKTVETGEIGGMVIAYEPIWAIGTGKTATPEDAQEMCSFIRECLSGSYGEEAATSLRVLYGGSVKPGNAAELMAMEDIDGALVGGASLKAADFAAITKFAS
jgi:triosephosphate isomerase